MIDKFIDQSAKRFAEFVQIESLPKFSITKKNFSLKETHEKGFGSYATHHYDYSTGMHSICLWDNESFYINSEYILFHEFTHIWDTEVYARMDKMKAAMCRGYSEYHASQIEFLKVLGAGSADSQFNFSMEVLLNVGARQKTAKEFLLAPLAAAIELISRSDFPTNVEAISVSIGLIFNYFGRRSICKMLSTNYSDDEDTSVVKNFIGEVLFNLLKSFLTCWLDESGVNLLGDVYFNLIGTKIKELKM